MRFQRIWKRRLEANRRGAHESVRCDWIRPPVRIDVKVMKSAGMLYLIKIKQCFVGVLERAEAFHVQALAPWPAKR